MCPLNPLIIVSCIKYLWITVVVPDTYIGTLKFKYEHFLTWKTSQQRIRVS